MISFNEWISINHFFTKGKKGAAAGAKAAFKKGGKKGGGGIGK